MRFFAILLPLLVTAAWSVAGAENELSNTTIPGHYELEPQGFFQWALMLEGSRAPKISLYVSPNQTLVYIERYESPDKITFEVVCGGQYEVQSSGNFVSKIKCPDKEITQSVNFMGITHEVVQKGIVLPLKTSLFPWSWELPPLYLIKKVN